MPVRARKMTSINQVRGVIARGAGGGALTRIKDKQALRVRFLGEPDTWLQFTEHFDETNGFYPCADDGTCPGCADHARGSKRFLANVIELSEKTVVALVLPLSLAEDLLACYDKVNTLMDRVYEVSRSGSGMKDTKYRVSWDDAKPANLSRFEPIDLEGLINTQLPSSDDVVEAGADEDDVDDIPVRKPVKKAAPAVARRSADDLDDDDFAPASRGTAVARVIKKVAPPAAKAAPLPTKKVLRRPGQ